MLSRSMYEMKECEIFFINGKVGSEEKSEKKAANKNVEIEGISVQSLH